MSPYTIVSREFTRVLVKKVGKDSWERQRLWMRGLTLCLWTERQPYYRLEAGKITFFAKCVQAVHSNAFPISLACLWIRAYIVFIVAEPGFIIQHDTVQAPCDTLSNNLSLAGKRPIQIKLSLTQIQYLYVKCQICTQRVTYVVVAQGICKFASCSQCIRRSAEFWDTLVKNKLRAMKYDEQKNSSREPWPLNSSGLVSVLHIWDAFSTARVAAQAYP